MGILLRFLAVLAGFLAIGQAGACTITATATVDLGTASPAAVARNALPLTQTRAGANCPAALITVLGTGRLTATFNSQNNLQLRRSAGVAGIPYVASADREARYRFTQNGTIDYIKERLLTLLGLLDGPADIPLFLKPQAATMPAGTYTDRITIAWSWYNCSGLVNLAGICVGGTETRGSGTAIINLTLLVAEQPVRIAIRSAATWDPENGTSYPKALPGSRLRMALDVTNPDLLAVDDGTLKLVVPTPGGARLALEGDGATTGDPIRPEGALATGMFFRFGGGGDGGDDVDFSADGGTDWSFAPVAGDAASQARVTHLRLRPRGAVPPRSAFTLSVPFEVR